MILEKGKTYFVKRGTLECYCTFIESVGSVYIFDNSGLTVIVNRNELSECVSE